MTDVGPMFLAVALAEVFEEYADDAIAAEAGQLLHDALTRHGYRLTPIEADPREGDRIRLNAAALSACRRFAGIADALGRDLDRAARVMAALDVEPDEARRIEDSAWHAVQLNGDWRAVTQAMATEERAAAADAVERDWGRMKADNTNHTHEASRAALRWWEQ